MTGRATKTTLGMKALGGDTRVCLTGNTPPLAAKSFGRSFPRSFFPGKRREKELAASRSRPLHRAWKSSAHMSPKIAPLEGKGGRPCRRAAGLLAQGSDVTPAFPLVPWSKWRAEKRPGQGGSGGRGKEASLPGMGWPLPGWLAACLPRTRSPSRQNPVPGTTRRGQRMLYKSLR